MNSWAEQVTSFLHGRGGRGERTCHRAGSWCVCGWKRTRITPVTGGRWDAIPSAVNSCTRHKTNSVDVVTIVDLLKAGRGYVVSDGAKALIDLTPWAANRGRRTAVQCAEESADRSAPPMDTWSTGEALRYRPRTQGCYGAAAGLELGPAGVSAWSEVTFTDSLGSYPVGYGRGRGGRGAQVRGARAGLDERQRRLWLGVEAREAGHGGVSAVARGGGVAADGGQGRG